MRALVITIAKKAGVGAMERVMGLTQKSPAGAGPLGVGDVWLDRDGGEVGWVDVDEAAVLALVLEANDAIDLGEEGVVFAAAYVGSGFERGAALTDNDASTEDGLTAEDLDAEPLGV
jgi:hypothetical protein